MTNLMDDFLPTVYPRQTPSATKSGTMAAGGGASLLPATIPHPRYPGSHSACAREPTQPSPVEERWPGCGSMASSFHGHGDGGTSTRAAPEARPPMALDLQSWQLGMWIG